MVCRSCGAVLARDLLLVPPDRIRRDEIDRRPTVPEGSVAVDPEALTWKAWSKDAGDHLYEQSPAGSIVIGSVDRVEGAVQEVGLAGGCCGLDGCNGPNQGCAACGTVVGTARTDCWTADEVRFLPKAVRLVES